MDKPPTEQHSDKLLPPVETSGRGETGQRKELLFSWLQTGNFCGKPYQRWREGGSELSPSSQGSWVLASSRWGCSDHRGDLPRDPHETCSTSVISPPQHTSAPLQPPKCCTFRIFSLTPATRTLVLRGTLVLVSKILSAGTLEATRHLTSAFHSPQKLPRPRQLQLLLPQKSHLSKTPKIRNPISFKRVKQMLKCWLDSGLFLLGKRKNCTHAINRTVTYLLKSMFFKQNFSFEMLSVTLARSSH